MLSASKYSRWSDRKVSQTHTEMHTHILAFLSVQGKYLPWIERKPKICMYFSMTAICLLRWEMSKGPLRVDSTAGQIYLSQALENCIWKNNDSQEGCSPDRWSLGWATDLHAHRKSCHRSAPTNCAQATTARSSPTPREVLWTMGKWVRIPLRHIVWISTFWSFLKNYQATETLTHTPYRWRKNSSVDFTSRLSVKWHF